MSNGRGGGELAIVGRFHATQSTLSEPYLARQQRARAATDATGEQARLKRQLAELGKDFQNLLFLQQRGDAQLADLQGKVKLLRGELASKDKALDLSRRTLDRLTVERAQLEGTAAQDKAYIRKLEARLLSVKSAVELQAKCTEYKCQVDDLMQQMKLAEARAAAAEEAQQRHQEEAAFLKRGIELAAEQLTKSAGAEVPATLLVALARAQEEGMAMSVQLADSQQQLAKLSSALQHARTHLMDQQQALEQLQEEATRVASELSATSSQLRTERAACAELRQVAASLQHQLAGVREERDALRRKLELERTAVVAAEGKVEQLEAASKQQARAEAALRGELCRLSTQLQGQQLQPHVEVLPSLPSQQQGRQAQPRMAGAVGAKRPAAPTPRGSEQLGGQGAGSLGQSPIQRLRLQREQQRARGGQPEGHAAAAPAWHGFFTGQPQQWDPPLEGLAELGLEFAGLDAGLEAPAKKVPSPAGKARDRQAKEPANGRELLSMKTSVLDEQINQLEGELAVLSATSSPTRLHQQLLQGLQHRQGQQAPQQQQPGPPDHVQAQAMQQQPQQQQCEADWQPPPSRLRQPASRAVRRTPGSGLGPSDPLSPSKATRKLAGMAPAAAAAVDTAADMQPSPKKLPPGWLPSEGAGPLEPGSPGGERIAAWRPNGAFEPGDADAVVLHASMPAPQALIQQQSGHQWAGPAAGGAAGKAPPPPLDIPQEGGDPCGGAVEYELTPPEQRTGSASRRAAHGTHQSRPQQAQQYRSGAQALLSPPVSEVSTGRGKGGGLVWHSNPLANTSPFDGKSPAVAGAQPSIAVRLEAAEVEAALGDLHHSRPGQGGPSADTGASLCEPVGAPPSRPGTAGSAASVGPRPAAEPTLPHELWGPPQVGRPAQVQQQDTGATGPGPAAQAAEAHALQHPQKQRGGQHQQQQGEQQRKGQQDWWEEEFQTIMSKGSQGESSREAAAGRRLPTASPQQSTQQPQLQPQAQEQQQQQQQQQRGGLWGGCGGALSPALPSQQWSLPSGATSWLNPAHEPDIDNLEVSSHRKPAAPQQPERQWQAQQQGARECQPSLLELATMDLDCF